MLGRATRNPTSLPHRGIGQMLTAVETIRPTPVPAISAKMIERYELTTTFPKRSVHRSKFPRLRTGAISEAYLV